MSLFPAGMKKIHLKMKALEWTQHFSDCKIFYRCSRAAKSAVQDLICLKFKLVQACMGVLVTCKNEKDPIKNEGTREINVIHLFLRRLRAADSADPGVIAEFQTHLRCHCLQE